MRGGITYVNRNYIRIPLVGEQLRFFVFDDYVLSENRQENNTFLNPHAHATAVSGLALAFATKIRETPINNNVEEGLPFLIT